MILDGYTEVFTCDEMTVIYRPTTHRTRRELLKLLRSVPATFGLRSILCPAVCSRIVSWDWRENPTPAVLLSIRDWHTPLFTKLSGTVLGVGTAQTERADAVNLAMGVRLRLLYPETEKLSCSDCQEWWCDPLSGEFVKLRGERIARGNAPLLCSTRDGCPVGTPAKQRRLSPKNKLAYEHYLECQATGNFPDDCIVRKNAKIIRSVTERVELECSLKRSTRTTLARPSKR